MFGMKNRGIVCVCDYFHLWFNTAYDTEITTLSTYNTLRFTWLKPGCFTMRMNWLLRLLLSFHIFVLFLSCAWFKLTTFLTYEQIINKYNFSCSVIFYSLNRYLRFKLFIAVCKFVLFLLWIFFIIHAIRITEWLEFVSKIKWTQLLLSVDIKWSNKK